MKKFIKYIVKAFATVFGVAAVIGVIKGILDTIFDCDVAKTFYEGMMESVHKDQPTATGYWNGMKLMFQEEMRKA